MPKMRDVRTEAQEEKEVKMGRPLANIDWKRIEELLMAGCSGREVASYFGFNPCTIYERCLIDHGITFSNYSQQFYEKGDSLLKATQYAKALGLTDKGDNTLLIWLGKTRLKQKEQEEQTVPKEIEQKFNSLMDMLKKDQDDLNAAEISNSEHIKS